MLVVAECFAADASGNPPRRRYLYTTFASLENAPSGRDPRTVGKLTPHLPAHCMHGPCQSGMLCLLTFVFRLCLSAAPSVAGTCIESVEPMYVLCSSMQPNTAAFSRQRAVGGAIICAEHFVVRHRFGIFGISVILALLRTPCERYAKHDDLGAS
jgi:hypothetical protein